MYNFLSKSFFCFLFLQRLCLGIYFNWIFTCWKKIAFSSHWHLLALFIRLGPTEVNLKQLQIGRAQKAKELEALLIDQCYPWRLKHCEVWISYINIFTLESMWIGPLLQCGWYQLFMHLRRAIQALRKALTLYLNLQISGVSQVG